MPRLVSATLLDQPAVAFGVDEGERVAALVPGQSKGCALDALIQRLGQGIGRETKREREREERRRKRWGEERKEDERERWDKD